MNGGAVRAILVQTFKESIRAKWLIMFTVTFLLLAVNVPLLALLAARYLPPDYLVVFLSTLVTLSFPFLPLLALPMGSTSIVDERESGTLEYVLSNPISKLDYILGKTGGLLVATTSVVVLGYGIAAIFVYNVNVAEYANVAGVMGMGALLNATMLGVALIISTLSRRKATALGIAIFIWFFFTVISDLGFLSVIVNVHQGEGVAAALILLNPIETSMVYTVANFGEGVSSLGTTGLIVNHYFGGALMTALGLTLFAWLAVFYVALFLLFKHQDTI